MSGGNRLGRAEPGASQVMSASGRQSAWPPLGVSTQGCRKDLGRPRLYINKSHENTDEARDFSLELEGVGTLSGEVEPHGYLLLHVDEDTPW